MKKIIIALAFIFPVGLVQAQTDTTGTKYDYYPDANVYYNSADHVYWYHDSASNQWQNAAQLPSGYSIGDNAKKNTFYYNGAEVWKDNSRHIKTYGKKNKTKKPAKQD